MQCVLHVQKACAFSESRRLEIEIASVGPNAWTRQEGPVACCEALIFKSLVVALARMAASPRLSGRMCEHACVLGGQFGLDASANRPRLHAE